MTDKPEPPITFAAAGDLCALVAQLMKSNGPQCLGTTREKYVEIIQGLEDTATLQRMVVEHRKAKGIRG